MIKIKDPLVRRGQIIEMMTMEKNRHQIMLHFLQADIQRVIHHLQRQLDKVDKQINLLVDKKGKGVKSSVIKLIRLTNPLPQEISLFRGPLVELPFDLFLAQGPSFSSRSVPWRIFSAPYR